jgi:hypothetical protein
MSDKSALVSYWTQAAGLTYGFVTTEIVVGGVAIFLGIATYATTYIFKQRENNFRSKDEERKVRDEARKIEIHTLQVLALKRDADSNEKVSK